MSGSLLGRGRGGRLAVYAGCVAVVVLLVFAYRAAVSEMARLRDLHEQCTMHQESLQQRLQVIFDYKVRLDRSLADETSANAAMKQELQQLASREKSRRDKDTVEAMQRYNSLQQAHKLLETQRKDLQEECDKRQKQALTDTTRLENTLQGLRAELKQARDDKVQSMEHLKSKYLQVDTEKTKLEEKYLELVKSNADINMQNQRLQKQIFQLNRELESAKKPSYNGENPVIPSLSSPSGSLSQANVKIPQEPAVDGQLEAGAGAGAGAGLASQNSINLARPPADQQVSSTTIPRMQTTRSSEISANNNKASSVKASTQSVEKIYAERAKVKLPIGVLPIPKIFDPEISPLATESKKENNPNADDVANEAVVDKGKSSLPGHEQNLVDPPRGPAIGKHVGDQNLNRQENWVWQHKVQPGVQEVGEDPNNLGKIPEFEDTGNHPIGDGVEYGQYEGGDYDKELPMKNHELHIEEGEDEGEDEDDPMEYEGNNLKPEKHPE